jgi:hypothetical protein
MKLVEIIKVIILQVSDKNNVGFIRLGKTPVEVNVIQAL